MKPGIYKNLTFAEYLEIEAVSNSFLSRFALSPAHAKAFAEGEQKASEAMLLGSAFHSKVLEPFDFDGHYVVEPVVNKRTKAGKEELAKFAEDNQGKDVISPDTATLVDRMAQAVNAHSLASKYLTGGETELTIVWECEGVLCKGRIDHKLDGIVTDLKSTRNASSIAFRSAVFNYLYHHQAAMYLDGIKVLTGEDCSFVFVAGEKTEPFGVSVHELGQDVIELGREEYLRNLGTYKECKVFDNWPCYPETLNQITL